MWPQTADNSTSKKEMREQFQQWENKELALRLCAFLCSPSWRAWPRPSAISQTQSRQTCAVSSCLTDQWTSFQQSEKPTIPYPAPHMANWRQEKSRAPNALEFSPFQCQLHCSNLARWSTMKQYAQLEAVVVAHIWHLRHGQEQARWRGHCMVEQPKNKNKMSALVCNHFLSYRSQKHTIRFKKIWS